MPLSEFEVIDRYFRRLTSPRADVDLGVGDDCALLTVPPGQTLALSMDTLVEGRHFLPGTDPETLGHKSLAVNLSDLAAIGAEPAWVTLSLTLPQADADWLNGFARGFGQLAQRFKVALVGGDTTQGPLAITVQAHGFVPLEQALRRDGAQAGDFIYVSGCLGDAGLAYAVRQGLELDEATAAALCARLDRPVPRIELGLALRGLANSTIDVSDGLAADLMHICEASGPLGARLVLERLPLSAAVRRHVERHGDWLLPLSFGDDYELCFTVAPAHHADVQRLARHLALNLTQIGVVAPEPGLQVHYPDATVRRLEPRGFDHFADRS